MVKKINAMKKMAFDFYLLKNIFLNESNGFRLLFIKKYFSK